MKTETLNTQKLRTFVRFFLLKDEPAQPLFKKKKKKKKGQFARTIKDTYAGCPSRTPVLFVLIVEEISSNCFIVVRSTL